MILHFAIKFCIFFLRSEMFLTMIIKRENKFLEQETRHKIRF